jgi:hypothetical protein
MHARNIHILLLKRIGLELPNRTFMRGLLVSLYKAALNSRPIDSADFFQQSQFATENHTCMRGSSASPRGIKNTGRNACAHRQECLCYVEPPCIVIMTYRMLETGSQACRYLQ